MAKTRLTDEGLVLTNDNGVDVTIKANHAATVDTYVKPPASDGTISTGSGGGGGSTSTTIVKASGQLLENSGDADDTLIVTVATAGTYRITGNISSDFPSGQTQTSWRLVPSGVTVTRVTGAVFRDSGSPKIAVKDATVADAFAGIADASSTDGETLFDTQTYFDVLVTVTGTGTLTLSYNYDNEDPDPTIQAGSSITYSLVS